MRKNMKKPILTLAVSGSVVFALIFLISMISIYSGVYQACKKAKADFGSQNCVDSLLQQINSEKYTFKERNTAIWAVGQIADKRALPILKIHYTGIPNHKEPLDKGISQYELKKAIKWCEKGNITSWMYKYLK